ncbi:MAG: phosphonate ABC transporter substrate-binding protein [Arenicella sp.]
MLFKSLLQKVAVATVVVAGTMTVLSAHAAEKKELNFGIISTESAQNLRAVWNPFLEAMEKKTGYKVNPFFAPDYAGVIQAMRFGKVDLAWYGNKSAMEAVDRSGGEIFAQTVDSDGNPGYWSLLVAHKDSPLNTVDDIKANAKDLVFGNGDPNSTSGFLVPSYYVFAKNDIQPKKAFKRVINANHQTNLMAAANKQVDFATNNTENWRRLEITNPEAVSKLKILWKSPLIPADPMVWKKDLPESTKGKIYDFFMTYGATGDKQELAVLEALQWAPFRASSNDQLVPIRQLVLFKKRVKIEQDSKLSDADKAEQLVAIDAQLGELNRKMAALKVLASN